MTCFEDKIYIVCNPSTRIYVFDGRVGEDRIKLGGLIHPGDIIIIIIIITLSTEVSERSNCRLVPY